jgi:chemotaxis protein MotB
MPKKRAKDGVSIVIRREEEGEHGHHGGAWKVAYADFVTAMMAFFLLMWLLNATTEQQRRGIAAYFSPLANVENGFSGAGLVPGGISPAENGVSLAMKGSGTPPNNAAAAQSAATQASMLDGAGMPHADPADDDGGSSGPEDAGSGHVDGPKTADTAREGAAAAAPDRSAAGAPGQPAAATAAGSKGEADAARAEDRALKAAAEQMRQALAATPAMAEVPDQMAIDLTPDALRIQILDSESKPMFARGSVVPNPRAVALLRTLAPFLARLNEKISIGGYTDAAPCPPGQPSNWSLSSGRADAARDVLVAGGLPDNRLLDVTGFADRHLLLPADPLASANRRVVLTVHRVHAAPPEPASPAAKGA